MWYMLMGKYLYSRLKMKVNIYSHCKQGQNTLVYLSPSAGQIIPHFCLITSAMPLSGSNGSVTLHGTANGTGTGKQWFSVNFMQNCSYYAITGNGTGHYWVSHPFFYSPSRSMHRFRAVCVSHKKFFPSSHALLQNLTDKLVLI